MNYSLKFYFFFQVMLNNFREFISDRVHVRGRGSLLVTNINNDLF